MQKGQGWDFIDNLKTRMGIPIPPQVWSKYGKSIYILGHEWERGAPLPSIKLVALKMPLIHRGDRGSVNQTVSLKIR